MLNALARLAWKLSSKSLFSGRGFFGWRGFLVGEDFWVSKDSWDFTGERVAIMQVLIKC